MGSCFFKEPEVSVPTSPSNCRASLSEEDRQRVAFLRSCRELINWRSKYQRLEYISEACRVVHQWESSNGQPLDFAKILSPDEIECLLWDSVDHRGWEIRESHVVRFTFIECVAMGGYRDRPPEIDPDGRPVLLRTTLVHCAAKNDRWELVGLLLDIYYRFDVNYIDEESGLTHYHIACMAGLASVERFIEQGQDPNGLVLTGTNDSPLHLALDYKYSNKAIEILLRRGADPNSVNAKGETPLHVVCKDRHDARALTKMLFVICDELHLQVRVNVRDNMGNTPLQLALTNDQLDVVKILLRNGADQNVTNENGETLLHVICKGQHNSRILKWMFKICDKLNLQLQVNAGDNMGNTPLHLALTNRRRTSAELLLRNGAGQNLTNENGETPLHIICKGDKDDDLIELFFKICDEKNLQLQVNARDNMGNAPLHLALTNGHVGVVKMLLRRGADQNLANENGETPLHVICKGRHDARALTEMFFGICGKLNLQVQLNVRDNLERTPLELAVANIKLTTVRFLWNREDFDGSSFVFPTERSFDECVASHADDSVESKLQLIPDVVGLLTFIKKAKKYDLVMSDILTIMKFSIKLGVYMLSVELSEELKNIEQDMKIFMHKLSYQKVRNHLTYDKLMRLGVHAASRHFTHFESLSTKRLFSHFDPYEHYVYLKICEIMLRGVFLHHATNNFMEMTGRILPRECCDMIITEDYTNNDLYNICLAAADESDRQNGEIDAMTNEINYYYVRRRRNDY